MLDQSFICRSKMLEILYQPVDSFVEDSYRELKDQIKETIIPYLAHNSDDKRLDKLILEFYASILNTLQAEVYINKYLFPAMDAIKYCLMNLHVDNILLLNMIDSKLQHFNLQS